MNEEAAIHRIAGDRHALSHNQRKLNLEGGIHKKHPAQKSVEDTTILKITKKSGWKTEEEAPES